MPAQQPSSAPETGRKPTGRQMYRIAYSLLEIAGIDAPATSADASALIERLQEQRDAVRAGATGEIEEF
jgi:hypothetical protein